jgi:hypothetical protein
MAAPNIISATTINGKTTGANLTTTAATVVLNNASGSGKCLKVNTLNVANYGANTAAVTVAWYNAANVGGTAFAIAGNVTVPSGGTVTVIQKNTQYYLEENNSLGATAGTANTLIVTCSYEDIS